MKFWLFHRHEGERAPVRNPRPSLRDHPQLGGVHFTGSTGTFQHIWRKIGAQIERYQGFRDAGLTELALRLHDDPLDALEIIGERVIPALR